MEGHWKKKNKIYIYIYVCVCVCVCVCMSVRYIENLKSLLTVVPSKI
jgi:hypothetical protein